MPDTIRKVDYYYTTVPNKPGEGAPLLGVFKDAGVNFLAIHAFPGSGEAQVDFLPGDTEAFMAAARKADVKLSDARTAFLIQGDDRVGATADTLASVGSAGINVTAVTSIVSGAGGQYGTLLWVNPEDVDKTATALGAK